MNSYFDAKYLALVGHVQSGKTNEEISYCYQSVKQHRVPVVFIVRNIKADQLQLRDRFNLLGKETLNVHLLSNLTIEETIKYMESLGIIILLCNEHQLLKIKRVILKYNKPYHLCIDEVDFSIKSKDFISNTDILLTFIKKNAKFILGATATPFALFSSEKTLSKVKRINPNKNYHGIETLCVNFVDSCIIRDENDFPLCDMAAMDIIYDNFMEKQHGVILHTVVKEKENHYRIQSYLNKCYPEITVLVYNGDGIRVVCPNRNNKPFADKKELNKYNQLINKYHFNGDGHYFTNYSISEVLQLLLDDLEHTHTHISIIAGHLASRGISFVSTDYRLHLTDQYFYAAKNTHGENLLQSLRILGCYNDNTELTLWCSERTWDAIIVQNKIINRLVDGIHDDIHWMAKIKEIQVKRPKNPLTRPRLCNYSMRPSQDKFVIDIFYPPESELETEI